MYPKFIEVHDNETQNPISINVNNIADFHVDYDGQTAVDVGREVYLVTESYGELKALITDCGCLIHKADPRLDMTHPLTLDDLRDMVGEPVWNSNLDRWELVTMVTDFFCKTCHTGQYAGEYSEDDLIKTPLYRMRQ